MSLVNFETLGSRRSRVREGKLLRWIVEDAVEEVCLLILHNISRPCWIFVSLGTIWPSYLNLVFAVVREPWRSIVVSLEGDRPDPILVLCAVELVSLPVVELPE
jgi:hypothetical protein